MTLSRPTARPEHQVVRGRSWAMMTARGSVCRARCRGRARVLPRPEPDRAYAVLKTRLETEKQTTALLTELNETRKSESDALRETVAAKNEAIVAKDAVIASQDTLIEALKKKKSSPWKRLGDVLIGAALYAVLK